VVNGNTNFKQTQIKLSKIEQLQYTLLTFGAEAKNITNNHTLPTIIAKLTN